MNKLIIALALIPSLAMATVKSEQDIMQMLATAPMARVVCGRLDYSDDCEQYVEDKIREDMLDSGYTKKEANACATSSLEPDEEAGRICTKAFGLLEEYEDFLNN
ncbi:hypothetical protein AG74_185 [Vibrio phage AG74]|uniref:Uncharacterized protein n=2 Tax=Thalassavirus TaxID=2948922 RepID=A0A6M9Z1K5_9CAUD|nr:hypothetical protein KNV05_gp125 [Vibrio phage River4]YP_010108207.1 hypothetical protein KNV06_gp122 [Vibrio phage AG74]QKN84830.1 hypothetical protein RIVER4_191 [Vibrio phage River4]QKN85021.1 hypothetical protein AG74_185 [Vibrio phage AG74]